MCSGLMLPRALIWNAKLCGDNMANQCLGIQQLQSCDSDVAQHPCLMCSGLILLMGTDTECQRENMMATEPLP